MSRNKKIQKQIKKTNKFYNNIYYYSVFEKTDMLGKNLIMIVRLMGFLLFEDYKVNYFITHIVRVNNGKFSCKFRRGR